MALDWCDGPSNDIIESTFYEAPPDLTRSSFCQYRRPSIDWHLAYSSDSEVELNNNDKLQKTPPDHLKLCDKVDNSTSIEQKQPKSSCPLICSWEKQEKSNASTVNSDSAKVKIRPNDYLIHSSSDEEDFGAKKKASQANTKHNRHRFIDTPENSETDYINEAVNQCSLSGRKGQKRPNHGDVNANHPKKHRYEANTEDEENFGRNRLPFCRAAKSNALNRIHHSFRKRSIDSVYSFDEEDDEPILKKKRRIIPKKKNKPAPFPRMKTSTNYKVNRRRKLYTMKIKKPVGIAAKVKASIDTVNDPTQDWNDVASNQCSNPVKFFDQIVQNLNRINEMAANKVLRHDVDNVRMEIDGLQKEINQQVVPQKKRKLYTEPEPKYDGFDMNQADEMKNYAKNKQQLWEQGEVEDDVYNQSPHLALSKSQKSAAADLEDHHSIVTIIKDKPQIASDPVDMDYIDDDMQTCTDSDDDDDNSDVSSSNDSDCSDCNGCGDDRDLNIVLELRKIANALNRLANMLQTRSLGTHT